MELLRNPSIVLVDLVHGAALDRDAVDAINRRPGHTMVVGLHDGDLGDVREVSDLNVDGFCRAGDWKPIADATPAHARSFALH